MKAYFDTSFLVSLYSVDANSTIAIRMIAMAPTPLLISALVELELYNALELKVFRKEISAAQARISRRDFDNDAQSGVVRISALTDEVFEKARQLSLRTTAKFGTRTADLLHVAAALEVKADTFYSFDSRQRRLAQTVQLKTP